MTDQALGPGTHHIANGAARLVLPDWLRLLAEPVAAAYVSVSVTTLRERGPDYKREVEGLEHDGVPE